ncbi:MAG: UDP-N-acetylmuramyl-tripeptide synthetase, partial [Actinobacteria bacterium]|nr:UDP-N-acetylmuramyl-tripeptide synthetase [Actinomycetota bacterium]
MTTTTLSTLVDGLNRRGIEATLRGDGDIVVDDAFHDDRAVRPGSLFCCVVGATADGHDHASAAVDAGAVALVCSRPIGAGVPEIIVPDVRIAMGPVAAMIHGDPSAELLCVGITGTNGKTTTAALIGSILRADGRNVEVIGTLSGVRTTPEATDLQRELAALRRRGCDALVMEVSSHGLAQHRVDGMHFDVAVFTNLGRDHLDYHETMEEYFRAKARLFEPSFSAQGVVDLDDAYGQLLRDASDIPMTGFRLADGDPVVAAAPIEFTWRGRPVHMSLAGRFNLANALAAATTASVLDVDDGTIRAGLEAADPVPGRFEVVPTTSGVTVVVDFAHTPDGIRAVI